MQKKKKNHKSTKNKFHKVYFMVFTYYESLKQKSIECWLFLFKKENNIAQPLITLIYYSNLFANY